MNEALNLDSIVRHSEAIVSRRIAGEAVLVPLRASGAELDSIYALNETAAFAWDLMDGKNSLRDILHSIMTEFEVDQADAQRDLLGLAAHLESMGVAERV